MSPATADVLSLRDFVERRDVSDADKMRRIARDVEALRVLSSTTTQAQRVGGDALAALVETVVPAIIGIENAIGEVPDPKALSHASSTDLSPEAIRKAALGTGLRREVAEIRVGLASLDRKLAVAGLATAAGATVFPAIFAALPGTAQVASGVVLALVTALGGLWVARSKKAPPALPPKEG